MLHRVWKNRASSGLEHARKWKFELEHARALENSTWSSFCPGIWLKMHYFSKICLFSKTRLHRALKNRASSMLEQQKLTSDGHFLGLSMLGCITPHLGIYFQAYCPSYPMQTFLTFLLGVKDLKCVSSLVSFLLFAQFWLSLTYSLIIFPYVGKVDHSGSYLLTGARQVFRKSQTTGSATIFNQ